MICSLVLLVFLQSGPTVLSHDSGRSQGPNDYSKLVPRPSSIKELVRFEAPKRLRIERLRIRFSGKPGQTEVHFWKDIDSSVRPYVPFRHFEFDIVPPLRLSVKPDHIKAWMDVSLVQTNRVFTLEKGERLFVGMVVKDGPRFSCDPQLHSRESSVVEAYDAKKPGPDQIALFAPAGDFMVRLVGTPVPADGAATFAETYRAAGDATALAWGDVDGDGFEDLLVNGYRLYLNLAGSGFVDASERTGLKDLKTDFGLFADFDNDGDADLFQGTSNRDLPDRILRNDGRGSFTPWERAVPDERLHGVSACAIDFDRDGLLDLFVANGARFGDLKSGDPSRLYRNEDSSFSIAFPGTFEASAGGGTPPFGSSVVAGDLDGGGRSSLFLGTYRLQPDQFWTFPSGRPVDTAPALGLDKWKSPSGQEGGGHSLGVEAGDYDNDGDVDLVVANLMHPDWRGYLGSNESAAFENMGARRLQRRPLRDLGISFEETPASLSMQDLDNDGRLDMIHNSMYHSANVYVWRSGLWRDRTNASGIRASKGTAVAAADFDRDGRIDVAIADKLRGLIVYRNVSRIQSWVSLRLRGAHCNRGAVGATVRIKLGSETLTRQVSSGRGIGCQDSIRLHFGLAGLTGRVSPEIVWPCGKRQTAGPLDLRTHHEIIEAP